MHLSLSETLHGVEVVGLGGSNCIGMWRRGDCIREKMFNEVFCWTEILVWDGFHCLVGFVVELWLCRVA